MSKNLIQLFNKYVASGLRRDWMESAEVISTRADKERRIVEVSAAFPNVIDKDELFAAENDIREAYQLNAVKILPKYPQNAFNERYIPEIFKEAANVRIEVRCFFDGSVYESSVDL